MHLASDYIHPTPRGGRCRIRIYLPEEEQDTPVVICSELPNKGGHARHLRRGAAGRGSDSLS
jgi:hypothetical protein